MAGAKEKIEEELTCSVCYELFETPLALPCLHSFCRKCLERITRINRELLCPLCKKDAGLGPNRTIDNLPKNHNLSNLVSAFKDLNAANPVAAVRASAISLREASAPFLSPSPSTPSRPNNTNPSAITRFPNASRPSRVFSTISRTANTSTNQTSAYSRASAPPANQPSAGSSGSTAAEEDEDFSWVEPYEQFLAMLTEGVPHHVTCSACSREVCGVRYRCRECDNFDLCSKCEASGRHDKHDMIKVVKPKTSFPRIVFRTENTFFKSTKILCDGCGQGISGVRYHCYECEDVDLCRACERKKLHQDHDMRRVVSAKLFRNNVPTSEEARRMRYSGQIHPRVTCDSCASAVRGYRYKCAVCKNYDLCASCLLNGSHIEHDMRRIDPSD